MITKLRGIKLKTPPIFPHNPKKKKVKKKTNPYNTTIQNSKAVINETKTAEMRKMKIPGQFHLLSQPYFVIFLPHNDNNEMFFRGFFTERYLLSA